VTPYVLPFDAVEPRFATEPRLCGALSSVLGKVQIGARSVLAANTVIRGDGHFVRIGDDFHLGEFSTVHIAPEVYPAIIGDSVTVGRNAVVHACTVGDRCVIEDDVVILDGSVVEDGVLIEAGSTVFPRSTLMAGRVYSGSPAKEIRGLSSIERSSRELRLRESNAASASSIGTDAPAEYALRDDVFAAQTARLAGRITLERDSSVFFGCHLDAGKSSIVIGEHSNIQDNTRIYCTGAEVTIGSHTTIGHNVLIKSCQIGQRALVGIGSIVSAGTIIDDDVLLAAGATTTEGQFLERGWMWGGRPARRISQINDAKRSMMAEIIEHYRNYGHAYGRAQRLTRPGA